MATFYLDPEGGNDANDGTSFANRWKTITNGATAARIAPGDTVKIKGSPNPTSLGITAKWTSGRRASTVNIISSTNATPIVITSDVHGYVTGQTIQITGHGTNTNANGTFEITVLSSTTFSLDNSVGNGVGSGGSARDITNSVVMLNSALTADICDCETVWSSVSNVITSLSFPDCKQNKGASTVSIAAGFTTGKAAYFATGTLNLSGYQQVSFWIKQTSGTVAIAGDISIRLCTDTAGATSVHTVPVPAIGGLNRWTCFTVNLGTNLNSAIASVALYVDTDRAAQTFIIDNIIAVKAASSPDCLSLVSLIGKNSADEYWWPIQSITGRRVILSCDSSVNSTSTSQRGYSGVTETVTTYKRETLKPVLGSATWGTIPEDGTSSNHIIFEGGWDDVSMSTKNMETWIDGQNGGVIGISTNGFDWIDLKSIRLVRYGTGISTSLAEVDIYYDDLIFVDCQTAFSTNSSSSRLTFGTVKAIACTNGITLTSLFCSIDTCVIGGISGTALTLSIRNTVNTVLSFNNSVGVSIGGNSRVKSLTSRNDTSVISNTVGFFGIIDSVDIDNAAAVFLTSSGGVQIYGGTINSNCTTIYNSVGFDSIFRNVTFGNVPIANSYTSARYDRRVYVENKDGVAGDHRVYMEDGLIQAQTSIRHTASGIAWAFSPMSTITRTSLYPVSQVLGPFYGQAGVSLTVTCWFYRTDTGLTGSLVAKSPQPGLASDVIATMVGSAGAWEQLSVTFTPATDGAYFVEAQFYGGSSFTGYIDDLVITQGSNSYTLPLDKPFNAQPFLWNEAQAGGGGGGMIFNPLNSPIIRGVI